MKLLIASDVHGSAPATKKLVDMYGKSGAERLVLLGDILYHGPRNDLPEGYAPKEVISLLSPLKEKILCVRGNCDAEVDQMVLPFPILAEYAVLFLDGRLVYLAHGHHSEPPLSKGDILISGHTHVPGIMEGEVIKMNPGSISIPKQGFPPTVLWYDDGVYSIRTFEGKELFHLEVRS